MPGKTRVSSLAKELGIPTAEALRMLAEMGEHAKSASGAVDAPVADELRRRCAGTSRPPARPAAAQRRYPRNNPYMDLGNTGIDHRQISDGREPREHRPTYSSPPRPMADVPRPQIADPLVVPSGKPRREWYRGDAPSGLTKYVLERKVVPQRSVRVKPPMPPWTYYEDEVKLAVRWSNRWATTMLSGLDFSDIYHWMNALGEEPWSLSGFPNHDPAEVAVRLHEAGVRPEDLGLWTYGDEQSGTLIMRLMIGQLTVEQVIVEVEARRERGD